MSLVGPRPNLFNQEELIQERGSRGVYDVLPGITVLAQVNNIDMSTRKLLAETDQQMNSTLTLVVVVKNIKSVVILPRIMALKNSIKNYTKYLRRIKKIGNSRITLDERRQVKSLKHFSAGLFREAR